MSSDRLDALSDSDRTIVLVEGDSDAAAVATLAERFGQVGSDAPEVVPAYGITNYRRLLTRLGAEHPHRRVVGLYDDPEEHVVRRALELAGVGRPTSRADIEQLGFFACVADLEDELIRALGVDRVEHLIDREGEVPALRMLQQQPAQQGRPVAQQLRRFMGTKSMRKVRYGHLLAAALDLDHCPDPLRQVVLAARS